MDLSPDWTAALAAMGRDAPHWSGVGAADAPDGDVPSWARNAGRVAFTNDLDFDTLLATSGASALGVVRLRTGSTLSSRIGTLVSRVLRETEADLLSGAPVTVEDDRLRLRPPTFDAKR